MIQGSQIINVKHFKDSQGIDTFNSLKAENLILRCIIVVLGLIIAVR